MKNRCKTCVWFISKNDSAIGSCIQFGDETLIASQSAVFDDTQKTKIPVVDVGENFGCIHWERKI